MENKGDKALELWREWFAENDRYFIDNTLVYDERGRTLCYFCGQYNPIWNGHADNCIYIRARALVKDPPFEGLGIEMDMGTADTELIFESGMVRSKIK